MRRLLAVALVGLVVSAASAQNNLRVYFSTQGWENTPDGLPDPQPVPTENTGGTNPSFATTGTHRLYVWGNALDGANSVVWSGVGLNVDVDGALTITEARFFNPDWFDPGNEVNVNRWNNAFAGNPPAPIPAGTTEVTGVNLVAVGNNGEYGIRRQPRADGFITDDITGGHVLLGYVDINATGNGDVFLEVGAAGIARRTGNVTNDRVQFGFGDTGLLGNAFQSRSAIADATVVIPEPASLVLLGLATLALRRR